MKINLKKCVKNNPKQTVILHITARLPDFILSPCDVTCHFQVTAEHHYDLVETEVSGTLTVVCQRCLEVFPYAYHHTMQLAVCRNDVDAARYMASFDCIVSETGDVDLLEVVTDELCLYCPEKHEDITHCQPIVPNEA